jgi:hypothetical protein
MGPEYAAETVSREILARLERRRASLAGDAGATAAEITAALTEARARYDEAGLPPPYFAALARELGPVLAERWRAVAEPYVALEGRGFGVWRGGDLIARLAFLFAGLVAGGLCVWAPFIPIWEKWFPFALAVAAFWLPDAQVAWHRGRYARQLGAIVRDAARLQPRLEAAVRLGDLLSAPDDVQAPPAQGRAP